jgi:hypothetical protein
MAMRELLMPAWPAMVSIRIETKLTKHHLETPTSTSVTGQPGSL